ncbi:MAG: amidohydrolase [Sphingobacteriaceae bacterium]|nr:amidohydrolase [Sphingobacteriaceae bacterium]
MKISLIQSKIYWEDQVANLIHFHQLIASIKSKTDLIVLPEMFTTGFTMNPKKQAEENGSTLLWMLAEAKKKKTVLMGSVAIKEKNKYYNRLYVAYPNGKHQHYDKRHLFRMAGEDQEYTAGKNKLIIKIGKWKICPLVCYDLRFPVWSRNKFTEKGSWDYDVLIYVANWPKARAYPWEQLLIARAIENQCFVAGVNRIGKDGNGIEYSGNSTVIDAKGISLAKFKNGAPGICTVELKKNELDKFRKNFPAGLDADKFKLI